MHVKSSQWISFGAGSHLSLSLHWVLTIHASCVEFCNVDRAVFFVLAREFAMNMTVVELGTVSSKTKDFSGFFAWDNPTFAFKRRPPFG
jgi:hypothetical protein